VFSFSLTDAVPFLVRRRDSFCTLVPIWEAVSGRTYFLARHASFVTLSCEVQPREPCARRFETSNFSTFSLQLPGQLHYRRVLLPRVRQRAALALRALLFGLRQGQALGDDFVN